MFIRRQNTLKKKKEVVKMFGLKRFDGVLVAKTHIHHGGDEKTGAETLLRRNKYVVDGEIEEIPYISGNAIRGVWRRNVMTDFFNILKYEIKGLRLYHAFFTGGVLETVDETKSGVIDLEFKKRINSLIPPISVLGMSYGNQIFEGKLKVGMLLPICSELKEYLPEEYARSCKKPVHDFLDFVHQTRKDDKREAREDNEQAIQMMINYEVFIAGTPFYHSFSLEDCSEVEEGVVARAVELWKECPYIGGKSSIGFGELGIHYNQFNLSSKPYLDFVKKNKKEIIELLKEIDK